ncbi:MAG: histidine kinase, partial [Burkholderiales bacterium]
MWLYPALALLLALPFVSDLVFPLGTAVWVAYLLPVVLAYLGQRPQLPPVMAALATLLTTLGFSMAPVGVDPQVAIINRSLGVAVCWMLAVIGYLFVRNRLAIRREEWLQNGQVGLANAVAGELPLDELAEKALRFLADYVNAQAGALFISNGDGFRRYATYAVPTESRVPEQFRVGDGLLGQAVSDQRSFLLSDVPDGYLYYGSGLGQAKPGSIIVAVTEADGAVNAVIELGLSDKGQHALVLLERICGQLGVSIRSGKYRARLRELLEETQQQADELQTQSEELRANNDELETQSRQLQESQARLEAQQSELEQTNVQLEEQARQLEAQRDNLSRAQVSLKTQAGELEQASRYKSEFLANMSHELR